MDKHQKYALDLKAHLEQIAEVLSKQTQGRLIYKFEFKYEIKKAIAWIKLWAEQPQSKEDQEDPEKKPNRILLYNDSIIEGDQFPAARIHQQHIALLTGRFLYEVMAFYVTASEQQVLRTISEKLGKKAKGEEKDKPDPEQPEMRKV